MDKNRFSRSRAQSCWGCLVLTQGQRHAPKGKQQDETERGAFFKPRYLMQEFPWRLSGKASACQCRETQVPSLGREDPLEKEMATHSSILAWRIPWTEEPGGLSSMSSERVGHSLATEQQQPNTSFTLYWLFLLYLNSYPNKQQFYHLSIKSFLPSVFCTFSLCPPPSFWPFISCMWGRKISENS